MKPKTKAFLMTMLVMLLWGSLFPMVKLGYRAYRVESVGDILLFAGIRFAVCGLVISLFTWARKRQAMLEIRHSIASVLLSGLFAIILHYGFSYMGLHGTDSSKTAILKQVGVLFYVCTSFIFFKNERFTLRKLIACIIGFSGIVFINAGGGQFRMNMGDCLIILASFCTVFSNVISKKALQSVHPMALTGVSQLFGGLVLTIIGLAMGGRVRMELSNCLTFVYICAASIVSYCVWFTVVRSGDLSNLFIIKFSEPVFGCVFGALILGENILRPQYAASLILISLGIFIANHQPNRNGSRLKEQTSAKEAKQAGEGNGHA